ncbi:hypothetical protein SISNIDRAFT_491463 [Sistotremastrum niveocremeum HHB9708]|uniref:Wings apart-like protein C-terminal domain-containing protein n=1 Tax=Sistotremastrum niveocremeum HHB9708 TaxID=1314777 RepID=A0A164MT28_9AGAM|nr:hypothetical protein SISNIDRAFT_491463 [Sistotremastrum niveocremeum HHB9708]
MSTSRRPPIQYGKKSSHFSAITKATQASEIPRSGILSRRDDSDDENHGAFTLPRKKRRKTSDERSDKLVNFHIEQAHSTANFSQELMQAEWVADSHQMDEESSSERDMEGVNEERDSPDSNGRDLRPGGSRIYGSARRSSSNSSPIRASPRDLSAIFTVDSSMRSLPSSPSKRGTAKRMLARHRTEPSLGSEVPSTQSVAKPLTKTYSLPSTTHITKAPSPPAPPNDVSNNPQPKPSPHKRTYAKSRSFLVAIPTSQISLRGIPEDDDKLLLRGSQNDLTPHEDSESLQETYDDLRLRWGVDDSDGNIPEEDAIPLKSLTEMRSHGESRRFMDEMGWLFEGLEGDSPLSVRTSSALEILDRMTKAEFMRRAKATDFHSRAWHVLFSARDSSDRILDACLLFFSCLVARDSQDVEELSNASPSFVASIVESLGRSPSDDVLTLTSIKAPSKPSARLLSHEKATGSQLLKLIASSHIFHDLTQPSVRLLALKALLSIPLGSLGDPQTLSSIVFRVLIADLREFGQASLDSPLSLCNLEGTTRCLDLYDKLLLNRDSSQMGVDTSEIPEIQSLVNGLVVLCARCLNFEDVTEELVEKAYEADLRVLLNVTHGNTAYCDAFRENDLGFLTLMRSLAFSHKRFSVSSKAKLPSESPESERAMDQFCLSLGILTNIIRESEVARTQLRHFTFSPDCRGSQLCRQRCHCLRRSSGITFLSSLYMTHARRTDSEPQSEDLLLASHIAVLLGLLCVNNPSNTEVLLDSLFGSSRNEKIDTLISHTQTFAACYSEILTSGTSNLSRRLKEEHPSSSPPSDPSSVAYEVVRLFRSIRDNGVV